MRQASGFAATACVVAFSVVAGAGGAWAQTAQQEVEARTEQIQPRPEALSDGPTVQFTSQRPPANAEEIVFTAEEIIFTAEEIGLSCPTWSELTLCKIIFQLALFVSMLYVNVYFEYYKLTS